MHNFLFRRTTWALLTLLLVTFLVYGLIRLMPGDPLTVRMENMGPKMPRVEDIERMRQMYGLNDAWYIAYFRWLAALVRGDLGHSFARNQPVSEIVADRVGPTLLLSITSLSLTYLLAIPLGMYATARSGKTDERAVSTLLYMLYSLPAFVAALLLQLLSAVKLRGTPLELPLFGMVSDNYTELSTTGKVWDVFRHSLLPVVCYTYGSLAYYSRFIHANMQEVIRQDYIRTARILWRHAFRNTLIPLVTMIGLTLPALLSGSIILEQIFEWPGMGRLFFESIRERDYPTMMALILLFSILTLAGQLLADILYAFVDPRVTYD